MVPRTTKNWQTLRSYFDSLNISSEECIRSYRGCHETCYISYVQPAARGRHAAQSKVLCDPFRLSMW